MKLAIVGSRNFCDYELLVKHANKYKATEIVSGGALGADFLGEKYAKDNGLLLKVFLPKFKIDSTISYDPKWFFERNKEIVEYCDKVLAFPMGKSSGTRHTIAYAKLKGKEVEIIENKRSF